MAKALMKGRCVKATLHQSRMGGRWLGWLFVAAVSAAPASLASIERSTRTSAAIYLARSAHPLRSLEEHDAVSAIVFVFSSKPRSTRAIDLAVAHNPTSQVVVIAPMAMREAMELAGATYVDITPLKRRLGHLVRGVYIHSSENGVLFERFCFERWLYVHQALAELPGASDGAIAVVDSDVLLFSDLTGVLRASRAKLRGRHTVIPILGAFTLTSVEALRRFVYYMLRVLSSDAHRYQRHVQQWGITRRCKDQTVVDPSMRRLGEDGLCTYSHYNDMCAAPACGAPVEPPLPQTPRFFPPPPPLRAGPI